jgi:type I restriction-modification system DNA methylase subunit
MTFSKILEQIAYRHNLMGVFNDFLQMSICALTHQKMEKEYLEVASRYDKKELELFANAFAQMFIDYEKAVTPEGGWVDLFGHFMMEHVSPSQAQRSGQFFTPEHVCDMMAKMTTEPTDTDITCNDPTGGSGRTLIAHCRTSPSMRLNTFYTAQDMDYTCVMMCTLNFIMFGMKGVVIHMNSLSMEIYRGYRVWLPETGMLISPLSKQECYQYLFTEKETTVMPVIQKPVNVEIPIQILQPQSGQLKLF